MRNEYLKLLKEKHKLNQKIKAFNLKYGGNLGLVKMSFCKGEMRKEH